MNITMTSDGIYKLTTSIDGILFENIWEIPHGVSLNSYVVKGEKTALIDGFCGWEGTPETFFAALEEMQVPLESVDYIIINHMEPDHSGWIDNIKDIKSDVQIYCSMLGKNLMEAFYGYTENIHVVKDGDILDLGGGRILQFETAMNVHWPDAIVTFDTLSGTLFSCDIFASYGSVDDKGYDDQIDEETTAFYEKEALRYYANIIGPFSSFALKAFGKISELPVEIVAPGHGIVWRKDPQRIIDDYVKYAKYQTAPASEEITLLWASMYGMTGRAVKAVENTLKDAGIVYHIHNVAEESWGMILGSVWNSSGIILAMPTYEGGMFPPMAALLEEIGKKKAMNRHAFQIGSYGWAGGAEKELKEINERMHMNWHFIPSVEFKGAPTEADMEQVRKGTQELIQIICRLEC